MLNRLFIVIGMLIIFAIIAGFVAPLFIDWSQYRDRLEAAASTALGKPVEVAGDLEINFLPQPGLRFTAVTVGTSDDPLMEIAAVEAKFSLLDFLRDHYDVTELLITEPVVHLTIGEDGRLRSLLELPDVVVDSNISVEDAEIAGGALRFTDRRSDTRFTADNFNGALQVGGPRGPFALEGRFEMDGRAYQGRFNSSALSPQGLLQVASFLRPADGRFSVQMQGVAETRDELRFDGDAELRLVFEESAEEAGVRGDLVLTSNVVADAERIVFSDYMVVPDANRPATRLSGAGSLTLGARPRFDLVLSGGVIELAPRNALAEGAEAQNELLALLNGLPEIFVPELPGHVSVDLAEVDLRAFTVRDLRLDASSRGQGWTVSELTGELAGDTELSLGGEIARTGEGPRFTGRVSLKTERLDAFVGQWRPASETNAFFNVAAGISGGLTLSNGEIALADGVFELDGTQNRISGSLRTGEELELDVTADLAALSAEQSRLLMALLPQNGLGLVGPQGIGRGSFDVAAKALTVWDLPARDMHAAGSWEGAGLRFSALSAQDWGGVGFDAAGALEGGLAAPQIWGAGTLELQRPQSALLDKLALQTGIEGHWQDLADGLAPLSLDFDLSPIEDGAQSLAISGSAGAISFEAAADFSAGAGRAMRAPLFVALDAEAEDPLAAAAQFGLPVLPVTADGAPVRLQLRADGSPLNSMDVQLMLAGGADSIEYSGNAFLTEAQNVRGSGMVAFTLADIGPLAALAGAENIGFGGAQGEAALRFGADAVALSELTANAGGTEVWGALTREPGAAGMRISGDLSFSQLDVANLAGALAGPAALAAEGPVWPEGPFALAQAGRAGAGSIGLSAERLMAGDAVLARAASTRLAWNATDTRLRDFTAEMGGGRLNFDLSLCCHSGLSERTLSGRASLETVALDSLLADAAAGPLGGIVSGALQISGSGGSFGEVMGAMTGEGSFTLEDLRVAGFGADAFRALSGVGNALEAEEARLTRTALDALEDGTFAAPRVSGVLAIAGGRVRAANVLAEGAASSVIGSLELSLADLALDGRWVMTPDEDARIMDAAQAGTAEVVATLGGTWLSPAVTLDVGSLVDGLKFKAYADEVDRLEAQRAAQEARAREAAEERARMRAEFARQQAERRRAEEEEEAAQRAAEAEQARQEAAAQEAAAQEAAAQDAAAQAEAERQAAEQAQEEQQAQQEQQQEEQRALDLLGAQPPGVNQFNPDFSLPEITFDPGRTF